ncbi:MAG: sulfotransferase [Nitrosopumilaceae archaeon]
MFTQVNKTRLGTRRLLRKKLDKHKKLQKLTTNIYLKYCKVSGFTHTLPDFLLIGFPKCGTTSLYEYLIQHPDIYSPIGKEIDYFDRLYSKGLDWYKVRFPLKIQKFFVKNVIGKNFITGEATPRYVYHPHTLVRIKKTIPNVKFIVLLRNPIERSFSHYNMNVRNGYEYLTFDNAIKRENERIKGRYEKMRNNENYYSWDYDLFGYLEQSKYFEKLKVWMAEFPQEQFLIIQSEDFLKNPSKIYHRVLKFLNLSKWEPEQYKLYKKKEYENSKINSTLRKELIEYFRPHNEKLYNLLRTNFNWNDI